MRVKVDRDREQTYADADVGHGVVVEMVRANDAEQWEVWAVRIDGTLYREPRDLNGEPLNPGPFSEALDRAAFQGTRVGGDD